MASMDSGSFLVLACLRVAWRDYCSGQRECDWINASRDLKRCPSSPARTPRDNAASNNILTAIVMNLFCYPLGPVAEE